MGEHRQPMIEEYTHIDSSDNVVLKVNLDEEMKVGSQFPNQLLFVIALVGMLLLCPAMVWVWNGPFFYARYAVPGIALSCPTKFSDSLFDAGFEIGCLAPVKKKKEWKCCDIWWRALMHTVDWTWTHWPDSLPAFFVSLSYQSFPIFQPEIK